MTNPIRKSHENAFEKSPLPDKKKSTKTVDFNNVLVNKDEHSQKPVRSMALFNNSKMSAVKNVNSRMFDNADAAIELSLSSNDKLYIKKEGG